MTTEQWRRIKAIVFEALTKDLALRPAFVAQACAGDEALLREVVSLLESMEQVDSRFDAPRFGLENSSPAFRSIPGADGLDPERADPIGHRIGPYEIQRELGRGGMGAVYLAARADRSSPTTSRSRSSSGEWTQTRSCDGSERSVRFSRTSSIPTSRGCSTAGPPAMACRTW